MAPWTAAAVYLLGGSLALGLIGAIGATGAVWLLWRIVQGRSRSASAEVPRRFHPGPVFAAAMLISTPVSCLWIGRPAPQPPSLRTVAAVEVPLRTPADRADLLAILRRLAGENGGHLDDVTAKWVEMRREASPNEPAFAKSVLTKTIYASVWRGTDDTDEEILIDDGGHQGRAWLTFSQGEKPELANKLRAEVLAEVKRRWPDSRDIPVMPDGALPLADDLRWTSKSYVVTPERAAAYDRSVKAAKD